ncbi:YebC/PmpR family DNA-binding transcriptional regulator [Corynebacterium diphtheriae]
MLEGGADAEEVVVSGDSFEILSDPSDLQSVAKALDEAGVEYESDELEFVPTMKVDLDASRAAPASPARSSTTPRSCTRSAAPRARRCWSSA